MNNLPKYIETLDMIESEITDLKIKTNDLAVKTSGTLLAVTLDHAQGIKFCLMNSAYPSAFSLLRILFETYIRAMWLGKCANSVQLENYIENDKIISSENKKIFFGDLVAEVESSYQLPSYFTEIKKNIWSGLNSLTHSGNIPLHKNFDGKSIGHTYEDEDINEAVDFSTMVSCMAFAGLCDLATNINKETEVNNLMKFVQSWAFNKSFKPTPESGAV